MPVSSLRVPRRAHIARVDHSDPLPYYYIPFTGWLFRWRLQLALDLLERPHYDRILEAGYGSGILLPTLSSLAGDVHAIDLHQRAHLASRMLRLEGATAHLMIGSVTQLSYASGSFDAAFCLSTLEHLHGDELRTAISELRRVLRPEGVALVGVPATGRAMELLFGAIGFSEIGEHHVSTRLEIEAELRRCFTVDREAHLPGILPRGVALYTVFRCKAR